MTADGHWNRSVGEQLRRARAEKGLTFAQVAEALYIRQPHLQAVEADDYAALPPSVYTRGLIRQYARYLGLDSVDLLAQYGKVKPPERDPVAPATPGLERPGPIPLQGLVLVLAVASLIGVFAYLQAQYNSFARSMELDGGVTPPALPTQTGRDVSALLTAFPSSTPLPSATAAPTPTETVGLAVDVRVVDRSWVQVWVDGAPLLAETLPSGTFRTFHASQGLRIRVGNAAGVDVTVNGAQQGLLGGPGQVVEASWVLG